VVQESDGAKAGKRET